MRGLERKTDIIVVGAGPAGLAVAIHLARRGVGVCVYERASVPVDRPCGDAHTLASRDALASLDLLDELPRVGHMSTGYSVSLAGKPPASFNPGPSENCLLIPRPVLSRVLLDAAGRAGAVVHTRHSAAGLQRGPSGEVLGVRVRSGRHEVTCNARLTILATGAGVQASRWLGLAPPCLGWAARCLLGVEHDVVLQEFHLHPDFLPGYLWVFPLAPGRLNVGVAFPDGTGGPGRLRRAVKAWLAPFVEERWPGLQHVVRSGAIGIEPPARTWPLGLALVGDAAGVADSFTGEGISRALETGILLADRVIERGLGERAMAMVASSFAGELRARYRTHRLISTTFSRMSTHAGLVRLSLAAAHRSAAGLRMINRLMTRR